MRLLLAQATNAPIVPVSTGIEWIDGILNSAPILLVAIAITCLSVGLAKAQWMPDRFVLIVNIVLGVLLYPPAIGALTLRNALIGVIAGFASNEISRRIVPAFLSSGPDKKPDPPAPKPPEPPTPPTP